MLASYYPRAMTPEINPEIRTPLAYMHGHLSGLFRFDENILPMKVVIENDGRLLAPTMVARERWSTSRPHDGGDAHGR